MSVVSALSPAGRNGLLVPLLAGLGLMLRLPTPRLDSALVVAHRIHGGGALALRDVLLNLRSAAQAAGACRHLRRR